LHQAWRVTTGRPAQACRDHYSKPTVIFLLILCKSQSRPAISRKWSARPSRCSCSFWIPLVWGCIITALDVLAVLYLQHKGFRLIEAIVVMLIATIGLCFASELFFRRISALSWAGSSRARIS
jgi:manganese transport protein